MKQDNIEDGWGEFLELCSIINTPEDFNRFFSLFLTFEERETMASRYLIIKTLLEGRLTQREIAEKHKVSIAQITRGSNALKIIHPKLRKFLEKNLKKRADSSSPINRISKGTKQDRQDRFAAE
jgi:TrpR family trp operon transcriptional repressor